MAAPVDESGWRQLIRAGQPPSWRALAEGSGGSVWEREGLLAAMVPIAPERSVFNSVFYRDGDAIVAWVAALPEARGRGVSGRLLAGALRDARD